APRSSAPGRGRGGMRPRRTTRPPTLETQTITPISNELETGLLHRRDRRELPEGIQRRRNPHRGREPGRGISGHPARVSPHGRTACALGSVLLLYPYLLQAPVAVGPAHGRGAR